MRFIQVNKSVGDELRRGLETMICDKQVMRDSENVFIIRRPFFVSTGLGMQCDFRKGDIVQVCPGNFLDFLIIGEAR